MGLSVWDSLAERRLASDPIRLVLGGQLSDVEGVRATGPKKASGTHCCGI
jgi:hypothetical protein